MTKEQRHILLIDLCARLIYGIFVKENRESLDNSPTIYTLNYHPCIDNCKPYLRSMSSMTEEETNEISKKLNYEFYIDDDGALCAEDDRHRVRVDLLEIYIDWLNEHYFDYRGLIEKDLALEAPEDMYNIK